MTLTPWHKVVYPREDLREGKPLDASRFAVKLDLIRDGKAQADYQDPRIFIERTYLTENLTALAAEAIRRLSGETTEASAVFSLATPFGGGKTHALSLLYHLAQVGSAADGWPGMGKILTKAGISSIPSAVVATFVGSEFDVLVGRGGGAEPVRRTLWGEIAFQLGGAQALSSVAEHDAKGIAPGGEIIRKFLPQEGSCLILIDELMNYVGRLRKTGSVDQLYYFIQNLSEVVSGMSRVVLVLAVPKSEIEMTAEDHEDYNRLTKVLNRVSKPVIISAESDNAEIIRRRLFEWPPGSVAPEGKIILSKEAIQTCKKYADWIKANKQQIPGWFPVDRAQEAFEATYPFHPMVFSVFERKWQSLPKFQRTRGVLRLLALWVSNAFRDSYTSAHTDALIGLGTAPLDEPFFRAAVLEQLNEDRLEAVITTDIGGKSEAHAARLDSMEDNKAIKKARLHRKVATVIFFESNGGQTRGAYATLPEVRLAVAEPDLDISNVETVRDALYTSCYFLHADGSRHWFALKITLNKIYIDRKASVLEPDIDERIKTEIVKNFNESSVLKSLFFPEKSSEIPDQPALTLIVLSPAHRRQDDTTIKLIDSMTREYGTSGRTFKNALIWAIADNSTAMANEARSVLAWEKIRDEADQIQLEDRQKREVAEKLERAKKDLRESVWRSYKNLALLSKENSTLMIDLGLVHSSAARTIIDFYLNYLKRSGHVVDNISPNFLVRNWPPAFQEWSTRAVRDAIFASPQFPRLLDADGVKETIASGVVNGIFAYVGKSVDGGYHPVYFNRSIPMEQIEISDDMYLVKELPQRPEKILISPDEASVELSGETSFAAKVLDGRGKELSGYRIEWMANGGIIDNQGRFHAGQEKGDFPVTASVGDIKASARVKVIGPAKLNRLVIYSSSRIISPGGSTSLSVKGIDDTNQEVPVGHVTWTTTGGSIDDQGEFRAGEKEGEFSITAVSGGVSETISIIVQEKVVQWEGEIPYQKWMNFYSKVLSKFAVRKRLKLIVGIEVRGISEEEEAEMRISLRELGLDDDITTTK